MGGDDASGLMQPINLFFSTALKYNIYLGLFV